MSNVYIFWFLAAFLFIWWGIWLARTLHRAWWCAREARRYRQRAMRRALSAYVMSQVKSPQRLSHVATLNRCDDAPPASESSELISERRN